MEISQQDLDRILKLHTGQDADSVRALLAHAANQITANITPEVSRKAADLIDKVLDNTQARVHLSADEVVLLKANGVRCLAPYVYRQIDDLLDPPPKPELKEIPKEDAAKTA